MAAPTEDDLEQKRKDIQKLREQVAATEAKAVTAAQEQSRVIEDKVLDAEMARLQAQLAAAKEAAKVSVVKDGAAGTLASVEDQLQAAREGITPIGVTVDTNAENPPNDTGAVVAEVEKKDGGSN